MTTEQENNNENKKSELGKLRTVFEEMVKASNQPLKQPSANSIQYSATVVQEVLSEVSTILHACNAIMWKWYVNIPEGAKADNIKALGVIESVRNEISKLSNNVYQVREPLYQIRRMKFKTERDLEQYPEKFNATCDHRFTFLKSIDHDEDEYECLYCYARIKVKAHSKKRSLEMKKKLGK